jgi:hypothetical protein
MIRKTISLIAISGLALIIGCGGNSTTNESSESPDSTIAQPTEDEATWVINAPGDAFSAAAAQTVCDLMRDWAPPAETSTAQVAELEKYANSLRRLVGKPSDAMYSASHAKILGHAEALLINEQQYPTDGVMPASFGWIDGACEKLGLTPENSRFGLKGKDASDIISETATPSNSVVETDKILGAICTTVPENLGATTYSGQPTEMYKCDRNGSRITLQVDTPEELANFERRWPFAKLIKTQLLCGNGWKLHFEKADSSPGDAGILYQQLSKAGIPSESCS